MYPVYSIHIREVKEGWVEIAAPNEAIAKKQALEGGFQSVGQTLCSFKRQVNEMIQRDGVWYII
jgi:hypothetical protein